MTRNPADYEPDEPRTNLSFQCYTENLHFSFRDSLSLKISVIPKVFQTERELTSLFAPTDVSYSVDSYLAKS